MGDDKSTKRLPRRYPFGLAVLAFALFFWLSLNFMLVGFPDRFMSELDTAEVQLVDIFNRISLVMALWCFGLGIAAGRWEIRKPFIFTCAVYAAVIIVSLAIDQYFRTHLMGSTGG